MPLRLKSRVTWAVAAAGIALAAGPASAAGAGLPGPAAPSKDEARLCAETDACQGIPALYSDNSAPPFDIQWSLGASGSFVKGSSGKWFEATTTPQVTLTREGLRGSVSVTGTADLVKPSNDKARVGNAEISGTADYALDEWTGIKLRGGLSMSQASAHDPSLATNTAEAPVNLSGKVSAAIARDLGHSRATLTASLERNTYSKTKLTDGTTQDNSAYDRTRYGAELRVDHDLTPIIGTFADGVLDYDAYDAPMSGLGVKADGWTGLLRAGLTGNWLDVFSAEASVGFGKHHYNSGALADAQTRLYDLSATFKPNDAVTLSGGYSTEIAPADVSSGTTLAISRTASADARIVVNPWLGLRGSISSTQSEYLGTGGTSKSLAAGLGADMSVAEHTKISADYGYSRTQDNTAAPRDSHTFTLGITVTR